MANKARRSSKSAPSMDSPKKSVSRGSSLWTKPIAWLGALVVAALGVALTNWLVPQFTAAINEVSQTGDPVVVQVSESENPYAIALPSSVRLSDSDLTELSRLSPEDQRARLKGLGGVSESGPISPITVTVTGNRANEVRITDIMPIADCSVPDTGTLVHTEGGFGATEDSTVMHLTVDGRPPAPYYVDKESKFPFFPAKTIALKRDEQVVIVIHAGVEHSLCSFELEMTVRDGSSTYLQRITKNDKPFVRRPPMEDPAFEHVYLGGYICKNYVEVQGHWTSDSCGAGNAGTFYSR